MKLNLLEIGINLLVLCFIIFILGLIFYLIELATEEEVLNECCKDKGGTPVTYSGCHDNFFVDCKDAHKSGWYCILEDSELNKSEVFKECTILVQGTE